MLDRHDYRMRVVQWLEHRAHNYEVKSSNHSPDCVCVFLFLICFNHLIAAILEHCIYSKKSTPIFIRCNLGTYAINTFCRTAMWPVHSSLAMSCDATGANLYRTLTFPWITSVTQRGEANMLRWLPLSHRSPPTPSPSAILSPFMNEKCLYSRTWLRSLLNVFRYATTLFCQAY